MFAELKVKPRLRFKDLYIDYRGEVAKDVVYTCLDLVEGAYGNIESVDEEIAVKVMGKSHRFFFGERSSEKTIGEVLDLLKCMVMLSGVKGDDCFIEFVPSVPPMIRIEIAESPRVVYGSILLILLSREVDLEESAREVNVSHGVSS